MDSAVRFNELETEMGTGGSASNRRQASSIGADVSKEEYIMHLEAEINRLTGGTGSSWKSKSHQRHRE